MDINYEVVPNIITGKDLDYLSDMFHWNYGAYKTVMNAKEQITDSEIQEMMEKAGNVFHGVMTDILNILANGGSDE